MFAIEKLKCIYLKKKNTKKKEITFSIRYFFFLLVFLRI